MAKMIQTRGKGNIEDRNFIDAMLNPNASFGGLYTFSKLPIITPKMLQDFENLSYQELCKSIFELLDLGVDSKILESALQSYMSFDMPNTPVQLSNVDENLFVLELYHGPTRAFKDMALQPFGKMMRMFAQDRDYLILVATSGDTGPATLKSFAQDSHIKVVCLYPKDGTSDVQRLQMVTQDSQNLKILGINGNFDDAQSTLKALLGDEEFHTFLHKKNIALSVANSVNIGRIAFQIVYHIWAYCQLCKNGSITRSESMSIIVPSGNFGNILGGFYAKKMGVPIHKLISACNANKILYEFITTGVYDIRHKHLIKTSSPAMDIIKSSNVERVLFELFGAERTRECMQALQDNGVYMLDSKELGMVQEYFAASFCEDKQCKNLIAQSFAKGYLLDPHTACGIQAYIEHKAQYGKQHKFVLCSTAEWSKFAPAVAEALDAKQGLSDKEAIDFILSKANVSLSPHISTIFEKPIIHNDVLHITDVKASIMKWLN